MFGARARAAEYQAAKAASARQQANQDADEQQIPKPAPVSLSAFTRKASTSRNKGPKTFVPLMLSEEEEKGSPGSHKCDPAYRQNNSSSPHSVKEELPRAASVPASRSSVPTCRIDIETSTQTPLRHRERLGSCFLSKTMYPEEPLSVHPHALPLHPPYFHTLFQPQVIVNQPILPVSHPGWYMPHGNNSGHYSHLDLSVTAHTPTSEVPPRLYRQPSYDSAMDSAPGQQNLSKEVLKKPPSSGTPELTGAILYAFGPDDLSPAKCEVKTAARQKYLAEHPAAIMHSSTTSTAEASVDPPKAPETRQGQVLRRAQYSAQFAQPKPQRPESQNLTSVLEEHKAVALPLPQSQPFEQRHVTAHKSQNTHTGSSIPVNEEPDRPYLGQFRGFPGKAVISYTNPTGKAQFHDSHIGPSFEDESIVYQEKKPAVTIPPPPGFETSRPDEGAFFWDVESKQLTDLQFPLIRVNSAQWFDIGPPTDADRDRMRQAIRAVGSASSAGNDMNSNKGLSRLISADFKQALKSSLCRYDSKMKRVGQLADEMQRKWVNEGECQTPTMSPDLAQKHAGEIRAVGSIMAALSMYTDDGCHRGARPYSQPPDYMIDRSVGPGGDGRNVSMFNWEEGENRVAPPRLARDPRFRPQIPDGINFGMEEGRVPRIFRRVNR